MDPKVYIIILNWNGKQDTLECIESLQRLDYENYEIVVVDNNSSDDSIEVIKQKFPYVHLLLNNRNLGFAEGNNVGINFALKKGAEYILLLNNDTVVAPDFLKRLIKVAESDKKIGIVGPKILYYNSNLRWCVGGMLNTLFCYTRFPKMNTLDNGTLTQPFDVSYIPGCALLIKRKVVKKIGLLDKDYFLYTEDFEWCHRAKLNGYPCLCVPTAVIWHKVSVSAGERGSNKLTPLRAYYYARNNILFIKKYYSGFKKIPPYIGQFFIRFPYYLQKMIREGTGNSVRYYIEGLIDGLKGIKGEKIFG